MDISSVALKLGLTSNKPLIRKAEELHRLSNVHFDSSLIGVGQVCKAIICVEIAATRIQVMFDRQSTIWMSGMSEKAYMRSFNAMLNGIGGRLPEWLMNAMQFFKCIELNQRRSRTSQNLILYQFTARLMWVILVMLIFIDSVAGTSFVYVANWYQSLW